MYKQQVANGNSQSVGNSINQVLGQASYPQAPVTSSVYQSTKELSLITDRTNGLVAELYKKLEPVRQVEDGVGSNENAVPSRSTTCDLDSVIRSHEETLVAVNLALIHLLESIRL